MTQKAEMVRDIMQTDVITATPDETIAAIAKKMCDHDIGFVPIVDASQHVLGVVTDRDIVIRAVASNMPLTTPAKQLMSTSSIQTVTPDTSIAATASCMGEGLVRRLPVVDQGKIVGIVTLGDVAQRAPLMHSAAQALHRVAEHQPV